MPNFSGVWNLKEQIQAIAAGRWTGLPLPELYTWGTNNTGQLGHNNVVYLSSPVQVGALTNWAQVSASTVSTACVTTENTLFTWGSSPYGRLGHNDTVSRSSPVQVGALTNWAQVSAGNDHTACVKTDGTLWSWGNNTYGALGHGTTGTGTSRSSPVQVGALTNWSQAALNLGFTACVTTAGALFTWGLNDRGQLGTNTFYNTNRNSPAQVGALTNWSQVTAGQRSAACVTSAGTLFTWGDNGFGQAGDNTIIRRSSPVQVGALTNWAQVTQGQAHTACVKSDGTIWTWGLGSSGRLGHNNIAYVSSPVQVGALTNWSQVAAGNQTVAILQGTTN